MVFDDPGKDAMKYARQIFAVENITVGEGNTSENFLIVAFNPANNGPLIMPSNINMYSMYIH